MVQKESSRGLLHSGETAHRSRNAIIEIIETGQADDSTKDILERFPDEVEIVDDEGAKKTVPLERWHSDDLRTQCEASIFESMSNFGKTQVVNKIAPGLLGAKLGQVFKGGPVHPPDAF
jgi:hypothetical protein